MRNIWHLLLVLFHPLGAFFVPFLSPWGVFCSIFVPLGRFLFHFRPPGTFFVPFSSPWDAFCSIFVPLGRFLVHFCTQGLTPEQCMFFGVTHVLLRSSACYFTSASYNDFKSDAFTHSFILSG